MALVRSLLFSLVFYPGTLLAVIGILPMPLFGEQAIRHYVLGWVRFHRWCARVLLGVTTRVEGQVPTTQVLFAAKHQAMYETLELVAIVPEPAIVVKQELAKMPLWGRAARHYGVIPIDREGSAAALRAMAATAKATAATGRNVMIFPEGTRVLPGDAPPLKPGFAGLYRALGLPVVPVALDSGKLWPRGFVKQAGVVTMRFGEPIPPGLPRREIEARVHAAINALEPAARA